VVDPDDLAAVEALLGRPPAGAFEVVVRHPDGSPLVIANAPLLDDGTPMPTRYWLVGEPERAQVGRLESEGGVNRSEADVDPAELDAAHRRYAAERDALIPATHTGPRPSGGVGGTRRGVKCLHAHYAWFLAGGDDPVGRWVADRLGAPGAGAAGDRVVGAVDCGTNSTRLLVAHAGDDGRLVTIERLMRITRLGQGVDATGRLAPEAIARTTAVLTEYREVLERHGATEVRATATSAARDAANRDDFFQAAEDALGARPELLPGSEEGLLSFLGATADLPVAGAPYLIADIGGGSTELVVGSFTSDGAPDVGGVTSLDVGCVRVTERHLHHDPPAPWELEEATVDLTGRLAAALDDLPGSRGATLVGLAGTVSALAAVEQGLDTYDRDRIHHHRLSAGSVEALTDRLSGLTVAERLEVPGIEPGRAEVIVGGCLVLRALVRAAGVTSLVVSEADILDGLAMSLLSRFGTP
jgi:exopolyphosphatase/guanosine-5'-triphosphate,3'-diphosphate pyrophosphatase